MANKKIKLTDLKVKSFVTTLNKKEQKTAKGGFRNNLIEDISGIQYWTAVKTQFRDSLDAGNRGEG